MTELSPAAAVLNAIKAISPAPADEIAAVALRAASGQVECDMPDNNTYAAGFYAALGKIFNIATELES